jgi:hypothetical protein
MKVRIEGKIRRGMLGRLGNVFNFFSQIGFEVKYGMMTVIKVDGCGITIILNHINEWLAS